MRNIACLLVYAKTVLPVDTHKKFIYVFGAVVLLAGVVWAGVLVFTEDNTKTTSESSVRPTSAEVFIDKNDVLVTQHSFEVTEAKKDIYQKPSMATSSRLSFVSATFELLGTEDNSTPYPRSQIFLRLTAQDKDGRIITSKPLLVLGEDDAHFLCHKQEPPTEFAGAIEFLQCWFAGSGMDIGIFLDTNQEGTQNVLVKSRYTGECGGTTEDCESYGALQMLVRVPLTDPLVVAENTLEVYKQIVQSFRASLAVQPDEVYEKQQQENAERFIAAMKREYGLQMIRARKIYALTQNNMDTLVYHYERSLRDDAEAFMRGITKLQPSMEVYAADINGDGLEDYFVYYQSALSCGAHKCGLTIFQTNTDPSIMGIVAIGSISVENGAPIFITTSTDRGYRALASPNHWFTGVGILKWDGIKYSFSSFVGKEDKPENTLVP